MAHNHNHNSGNLRIAFLLNFSFTLLEIIGGLWTNSIAILSDALHDLGDSLSIGMAWFLENYAKKGSDQRFSYGYRRFSLLGALLNALVLLVGSIFVLREAIPRLFNPEATNALGMLLFAIIGVAVNGLAVLRMRKGSGLNAKVVTWHLLEDVFGWLAILMASIVMIFADIPVLDPILSLGITIYVLFNVLRYLKQTLTLFLQGVPEGVDVKELEEKLNELDEVSAIHHTHIWSLDGEHHVLTTHLVVAPSVSSLEIAQLKQKVQALLEPHEFTHITLEIEKEGEGCSMVPKINIP